MVADGSAIRDCRCFHHLVATLISTSMSWPIVALPAALVVGLVLLIVGLRGRRVGEEPRCRKCKYELTGLTTDRCPECGTTITPETTVYGLRCRRAAFWIPGALLLLMTASGAGVGVYVRVKNLTYRDYPVYVLTWLAGRDDRQALSELRFRLLQKKLAPGDLRGFFPTALDRFRRADTHMERIRWLGIVDGIHAPGILNDQECRALYDAGARVRWRWRPRVRQGDTLRIWLDQSIWAFGYPAYDRLKVEARITFKNREPVVFEPREWAIGQRCMFGMGEYRDAAMTAEPGTQEFVLQVKRTFYRLAGGDFAVAFERSERTEASVEVLPADAPDTLRLLDEPALAERFAKAVAVTIAMQDASGRTVDWGFAVNVNAVTPVPMDAVFVLKLISDETEQFLGTYEFRASKPLPQGASLHYPFDRLRPGVEYTPVLRPSAKYARLTPDIFRIWNGELRCEPFTLESLRGQAGEAAVRASSPRSRAVPPMTQPHE